MEYICAAYLTLASGVLLFVLAFRTGMARGKAGIKIVDSMKAKDEAFLIANRTHMNTLESTAIFLPFLWIATLYGNESVAAGFGAVWILARIGYAVLTNIDVKKRTPAFMLSIVCLFGLLLTSLYGLIF